VTIMPSITGWPATKSPAPPEHPLPLDSRPVDDAEDEIDTYRERTSGLEQDGTNHCRR